ncbi:hydroxyacid dehydrogenase [Candidatus Saccharibacteria bacterium CPR2]|nr:hydroxyacid dehydrogenase [Candidatus Saccharibacteria bacterium CPR2]
MAQTIYFYNATDEDEEFFSHELSDQEKWHVHFSEKCLKEICDPADSTPPQDTTILCVNHTSNVTKEFIDTLPQLKMIATRSTGFNHIDLDAAKEKGIIVTNVPTYGENTVAEFAFSILLALSRKIKPCIESVDTGQVDYGQLRGFDLAGKTIGVIGTGRIGAHVIKIAKGFEMDVLGYDPYPNEELRQKYEFEYVDLDTLLGKSDVVTLHAPSTEENTHLINKKTLAKMKNTAVLVNTARGDLVETTDLIDALKDGVIAGAALDVMEGENLLNFDEEANLIHSQAKTHELQLAIEHEILEKMPNVVLTPHNAFNTEGALARIRQTSLENIRAFADGNPKNIVS